MNLERRVVALEMALRVEEPPLPGFCPIQQEGETESEFKVRIAAIHSDHPGHKVIPLFVIDGSKVAKSDECNGERS